LATKPNYENGAKLVLCNFSVYLRILQGHYLKLFGDKRCILKVFGWRECLPKTTEVERERERERPVYTCN